jgi:hypothetical protein
MAKKNWHPIDCWAAVLAGNKHEPDILHGILFLKHIYINWYFGGFSAFES